MSRFKITRMSGKSNKTLMGCNYFGCPLKEKCHRFSPVKKENFYTNPSRIIKGKFTCDMYVGDSAHLLFEQLKSILKNRKKP